LAENTEVGGISK